MEPLNPWLETTLRKAERLFEDSDRKCFAAMVFLDLIRRVQRLASNSAIRCGEPKLERYQPEEGSPVLQLEWSDPSASWYLCFSVRRAQQQRPSVMVEFNGTRSFTADKPSDADIIRALNAYFEDWKRSEAPTR